MATGIELHPVILSEILLVEGLIQDHIDRAETIHHLPQCRPRHHGITLGMTGLQADDFVDGITQQADTAVLPEAGEADGCIRTGRLHSQFCRDLKNLKLTACIDPQKHQRIGIGQPGRSCSIAAIPHPIGVDAHQQNGDRRQRIGSEAGGVLERRRCIAGHLVRFRPHQTNQPTCGTHPGKDAGNPKRDTPRMPRPPMGFRLRFGGRHRPSNANGA